MTQSTRGLRPAWRAAAAVGALAVTAACNPGEAGAAAVVGDRRISNEQLQNALTGLRTGNPEFAQIEELDRPVLFSLIAEPYLLQAARAEGLGVSPSEARSALPRAEDPDPNALRALQAQLALNKLDRGQRSQALARVADQLRRAGVRVSPRYGTFDAKAMTIVDARPNWLAQPKTPSTEQPTDAPGGQPTEQPGGQPPGQPPPQPTDAPTTP